MASTCPSRALQRTSEAGWLTSAVFLIGLFAALPGAYAEPPRNGTSSLPGPCSSVGPEPGRPGEEGWRGTQRRGGQDDARAAPKRRDEREGPVCTGQRPRRIRAARERESDRRAGSCVCAAEHGWVGRAHRGLGCEVPGPVLASGDGHSQRGRRRQRDDLRRSDLGEPALTVPRTPEYPSGHALFTGVAETVLRELFGTDRWPSRSPTPTRTYTNVHEFLRDREERRRRARLGRHYFRSADIDGTGLGRQVAEYALKNCMRPTAK